jgi:hypothetical protein
VQRIMNATVHSATVRPASIITPGVDLNDGLVFPANSSSSTPTTVSDYVDRDIKHAIIVRKVQNALGSKSNKAKYDKSTRIAVSFPMDHSYCFVPRHSPTNKIIHTEDGTYQVLSHRRSISQSSQGNPAKAHIVIVALRLISHFSD